MDQGGQERDQMDEAVVSQVPRQRRPGAASRPGEGESLHNSGTHGDSVATLAEAKAILGIE